MLVDEGEGKKGGGRGGIGTVFRKASGGQKIVIYVIAAIVIIGVIVASAS